MAPYERPIAIADKLSDVTRPAAVCCVLLAELAMGAPLASFNVSDVTAVLGRLHLLLLAGYQVFNLGDK